MQCSRRLEGREIILLVAFVGVLLGGGSILAQARPSPPAPPPPAAQAPVGSFVSRETVDVTNVDVVVEDSKGNRVTGLRKDDFTVIEDGMEQPITNFFAVEQGRMTVVGDEEIPEAPAPSPAAPAAPSPAAVPAVKTKIVIFVDNLSLTPAQPQPGLPEPRGVGPRRREGQRRRDDRRLEPLAEGAAEVHERRA